MEHIFLFYLLFDLKTKNYIHESTFLSYGQTVSTNFQKCKTMLAMNGPEMQRWQKFPWENFGRALPPLSCDWVLRRRKLPLLEKASLKSVECEFEFQREFGFEFPK